MSRIALAVSLIALFLLPVAALAHGKAAHIMGTVKKISDTELTVETPKETVEVHVDSKTKFLHSGEAATLADLKVGERVVVEADAHAGHQKAVVVKWGAPSAEPMHSH